MEGKQMKDTNGKLHLDTLPLKYVWGQDDFIVHFTWKHGIVWSSTVGQKMSKNIVNMIECTEGFIS